MKGYAAFGYRSLVRLVGGHSGWRNGGGVWGSEFIDCGKNMFMDEVIRGWGVGSGEWGVKREARISHLSSSLMMRFCLFLVF